MRSCQVAVLGLGLMGSAAAFALARRGADVIGFEPMALGEARGSSHGSCRVYRRFNFESTAYTELSDRAYRGWRTLETLSGRSILQSSPVLEAGPPGSALVAASRAAAMQHGGVAGPSTGAEANRLYPALDLPADWDVAVQESGGILMAEAAIRAFRDCARTPIIPHAASIRPGPSGIHIETAEGEVLAERVIVAAGPWIVKVLPELSAHLKITRQTVGWFKPADPGAARPGALPVFIVDGPDGPVYGFPDFEGRGVKAALHSHGPVVGPDEWDPPAMDGELEPVRRTLAEFLPGAAGPIVARDVCLYTNALAPDARPGEGEEFIIDRRPGDPRIIVASPCSGHGAKFATAIGEMLAELALNPGYAPPDPFRLDRFSTFAP